jgi:rhodanese-related sulfurtransferase
VLYCRSGGRAALAALSLAMLGLDVVRTLTGGIMSWTEADLPIVVPG